MFTGSPRDKLQSRCRNISLYIRQKSDKIDSGKQFGAWFISWLECLLYGLVCYSARWCRCALTLHSTDEHQNSTTVRSRKKLFEELLRQTMYIFLKKNVFIFDSFFKIFQNYSKSFCNLNFLKSFHEISLRCLKVIEEIISKIMRIFSKFL